MTTFFPSVFGLSGSLPFSLSNVQLGAQQDLLSRPRLRQGTETAFSSPVKDADLRTPVNVFKRG